jgi:signal transduction histidine kinase
MLEVFISSEAQMSVDWWGFDQSLNFNFPSSALGYLAGGIALALLIVFYIRFPAHFPATSKKNRERFWVRLPFLLIAAPILSLTFLLRFHVPGTEMLAFVPQELRGPAVAVFGAIPWLFAGGVLGIREAIVVGVVAGVARAGFETFSVLTPIFMGLQAGIAAWLMRRDNGGLQGRLLRSPFISGLASGAVYALLRGIGIFVTIQGDLYRRIDITLSLLGLTALATMIEVTIGGAFCELIKRQAANIWYEPRRDKTRGFGQSLAVRLSVVLLFSGFIASSVILMGDWVSADQSAREILTEHMQQTANQASGIIPFFVHTGREYSRQLADDLAVRVGSGSWTEEPLDALLRAYTFFESLAVYDRKLGLEVTYPAATEPPGYSQGFQANLTAALRGVPSETIEFGSAAGTGTRMAFITPVLPDENGQAVGVVVGWSSLESNLILTPLVQSFDQFSYGSAFVTDELGEVLIHPESDLTNRQFNLRPETSGTVRIEFTQDGTRQLVYVEPIEEYSWHVVVIVPLREVHRQALQITLRLGSWLVVVGVVLLCAVFLISHRLTRPLRKMAQVAQSIARGNLDQPVKANGEDEIGRFASSFEMMRRSLKARLDEMGLLLDVSQRLSTSFDLTEMLQPILDGIRQIAAADHVRIALAAAYDEARFTGFSAGDDPGNWAALDPQILALSSHRGRFVLENPTRAGAVLDLTNLSEPIETLAAMPMRHEDEFVGVLWLGHRSPYVMTPDALNLLSILSDQLAVAITKVRLYQRAEHERMRLVTVLEGTPAAVMMVDSVGRVSLLNPAAASLFSAGERESLGKPVADVVQNPDLRVLLLDGGVTEHATEIEMDSGRIMFASVTDIRYEDGVPAGRICVLWDVSHYKKLDALKSEFVSTVSQDLRAPLTLMRGYATMLSMVGDVNEQQEEFLQKILSSIDHMSKLVDNLLDLGRIEAGMGLNVSSIRIEALIKDVVDAYRPQAVSKRVAIEVELVDGMQPVDADPGLLRQAISNLVDNALKYTPANGRVVVRAEQSEEDQIISVADTGVGIAPADQARLFEKFYRTSATDALHEKGLGLGLAIVKSIVEQHNGWIQVESRLGQGSTFTISVPLKSAGAGEGKRTTINFR